VKGRAPMTGYARELFGPAWADVDGNGCDTRDDVLARDVVDPRFEEGSECVVVSGRLPEPYTGRTVHFERGYGDSVDIDHVVSLGNAWVTGAFRWSDATRLRFANDPANLLAVDASSNRQKGDGDAATWLPSNKAFRCTYVVRQVVVKAAYGLWVTAPERAAIVRVLSRCSAEPAVLHETDARRPTPSVTAPTVTPRSPAVGGPFVNCDAARAAGAAPVHRGDAGYSRRLDRDGDGTGCE
jgi:hypothetical protein